MFRRQRIHKNVERRKSTLCEQKRFAGIITLPKIMFYLRQLDGISLACSCFEVRMIESEFNTQMGNGTKHSLEPPFAGAQISNFAVGATV